VGGYFSTRWARERTRQDTDPRLSLDIRWLRRIGALAPGALAFPSWTCRGEPSGSIVTMMNAAGDTLTLAYTVTDRVTGAKESIRDPIALESTPCHYGGERVWFCCPGCGSRRAVLFSVGGRFRCRACHDLAYTSTREDAFERKTRKCARIRKKLGETSSYGVPWETLPPKPPRMHRRTYWRLLRELRQTTAAGNELFLKDLERLAARVDRLTK